MDKIFSEIKRIKKAIGLYEIFRLIISMIKKFFYDVPHFWFRIAHYNFRWEFANSYLFPVKLNKRIKNKRLELNINFLKKKYWKFISDYKKKDIEIWRNDKKIRVLWWQWIEKAPDLVKICVNSIKQHNCGYEIVFLDESNYGKYIKLPEYILEKVKKWYITITHLSDIVRMALLKEYGWIWIDATMFVNSDIFKKFNDINLNTNNPDRFVAETWNFEKWCGFFIWWRTNRLFNFCYDFFMEYHKDYNQLINYFLIDYAIYIAYQSFDDVKKDIDNVNIKNSNLYDLTKKFNEAYNENKWSKLMENDFFKLTFKLKFNEYDDNWKLTNYGKFLQLK